MLWHPTFPAALLGVFCCLPGPEGKSSAKRITELQAQVASLQAALKSRGLSKGLAAVIEATKTAGSGGSVGGSGRPGDGSQQVAALQKKVDQLNAKLEEKVRDT